MDALQSLIASVYNRSSSTTNRRYLQVVGCLWLVLVLVICVRVGLSPVRQSSFSRDYVPAGSHWLMGQEVYAVQQSFVYSPIVAASFAPFATLPLGLSNIVWRLLSVAVLLAITAAWLRSGLSGLGDVTPPAIKSSDVTTGFLLLLPLAGGNVNIGQINILVLVFVAGGVLAVQKQRWNLAALLLAAAGFIKIYPLAVGLLLILFYPRQLGLRLVLVLCALFLLSLCLQNPVFVLTEYRHWFAVLGNDNRLDVEIYATWRDFGFLLRACGVPLSNHLYRVLEVAAGGALALFLWLASRRQHWSETRLLGGIFSLGCAWMLLFGPATESATYVVLALAVCAALVAVWRLRDESPSLHTVSLPGIFLASYILLLSADLGNAWLHDFTHHLYIRALQPVATLFFTAGTVLWLLRKPLDDQNARLHSGWMPEGEGTPNRL